MTTRSAARNLLLGSVLASALMAGAGYGPVQAREVNVSMVAKEVDVPIDNEGKTARGWTYDGVVPGPLVRVQEGDTVVFSLTNDAASKNSHSMDFHAARTDLLTAFAPVKPGETRKFTFVAEKPGVFFYHCGTDPMIQHIARGMYGVILVDPKDPQAMPKADREYVLVQSEMFSNPEDVKAMMAGNWSHTSFNGIPFRYDPVHDTHATQTLEAKPGERVRIYFVNAGPNEFSGFHPIAGIWDRVYPSGNPANMVRDVQTYTVAPGDAATFDLISPVEGANALVNHSLRSALSGAIAVIMFSNKADPSMGRGDKILVR